MLVAEGVCTALWDPKHMHVASETWLCSMIFCMAWMKRNHQRQGKARQGMFFMVPKACFPSSVNQRL